MPATKTAPKGTAAAQRAEEDKILKALAKGKPLALSQLPGTRYRVRRMLDAKLIKRDGEAKLTDARKAVLYSLTAKGKKRAEKL